MKRIVKSLFVIVTVDISGWIVTPGMVGVLLRMGFNDQQMYAWGYFAKIFINIALAVKLFIYYTTSTEYRSAINAFALRMKPKKPTKTITWISVTNV
ncbi:hypothetical protein PRIPAC_74264 [Pristionchus pacificus]|uniref:G protein-coupled receptor n=1 Tax=Pristionchus pacificus TaxID=54126 RepID=A0A2A6BRI0_PRIPA|nr:hypothetical protein PRIPAC_74264 [Pristionchus pacificus]|eukprot:PDM68539.1 G protein-coupled receptor [Pristionchus pacificus]